MLMRYELKKVFSKRVNQIVLILLAVLLAYTCQSALVKVEWVDGQGNSETGHAAAVNLREASQDWSGSLDQQLLEKVLVQLKAIYSSTEVDPQSQESNWILSHQLQGFQDIADLLGWAYQTEYASFEEMVMDLQPEDLSRFYTIRINDRKNWLYEDDSSWGFYNYSPREKQYILDKFEALQTPLETGYHEGWVQATEQLPTLLKYGMILLSFVLAGIFADEFSWKTDAVYYNTLHGRTRATAVKGGVGFLTITVAYWLCVGVYSLIVLGSLGTDGGNCSIQVHAAYWNIREQMTFRQFYLLAIVTGYLGYLFVGFFVLWISAKTKSPVLAVLIPSLILLLPGFLWNFYSPTMRRIIGILPDKLLDIGVAIQYLYLYTLGERVMTAVPIVATVYTCATVLLVFLCYREYRHKEVT